MFQCCNKWHTTERRGKACQKFLLFTYFDHIWSDMFSFQMVLNNFLSCHQHSKYLSDFNFRWVNKWVSPWGARRENQTDSQGKSGKCEDYDSSFCLFWRNCNLAYYLCVLINFLTDLDGIWRVSITRLEVFLRVKGQHNLRIFIK